MIPAFLGLAGPLIAGGLREGGVVTCAKTTGTLARMILPDGRFLAMFSRHMNDKIIHYRLSTDPGDATQWDPEKNRHRLDAARPQE